MLINGECLIELKNLPDKSVDFFYLDLPYGETNCSWDKKLDMDKLWKELWRLSRHKRVAYVFSCSTKFGYTLIKSWEKGFKMDLVWKKRNKTGGIYSRYRPMKNHEMVYFFYRKAPKYNRDKYHKRIKQTKKVPNKKEADKDEYYEYTDKGSNTYGKKKIKKNGFKKQHFEPTNPASVIETDKDYVYANKEYHKDRKVKGTIGNSFNPPNPASVIESDKDKLTIYGKDKKMVGKQNPSYKAWFEPTNPASVIEPDIYGETQVEQKKRGKKFEYAFKPPNPASVIEPDNKKTWVSETGKVFIMDETCYGWNEIDTETGKTKSNFGTNSFEPPNPSSVIEPDKTCYGIDKKKANKTNPKHKHTFNPPNPASVIETKDKCLPKWKNGTKEYGGEGTGWSKTGTGFGANFEPPNPASVIEPEKKPYYSKDKVDKLGFSPWGLYLQTNPRKGGKFEPPNPSTIFESEKVFIGKRFHQTQKPLDLMEFLLKYWTDEGDVVLDPTMGSGSMGVMCKRMGRTFIGIEKDPEIFKKAKNRIDKQEKVTKITSGNPVAPLTKITFGNPVATHIEL
jgi:DNA modification methylase